MIGRSLVGAAGCLAALWIAEGSLRAGRMPQDVNASSQTAASPRATLDRYCVGCHNANVRTADLTLDTLQPETAGENPEAWEKVVRKLRGRMMPPPGRARPDEATYNSAISFLETTLDRAASAHPNPGR